MPTRTAVEDQEPRRRPECWCCGSFNDPGLMVRLGNHPEVAICTRCAHSISKWASEIEDRDRTGLPVRARDAFRRLRKAVVRRGWHHHHRLLGRPLRWLGRHTP